MDKFDDVFGRHILLHTPCGKSIVKAGIGARDIDALKRISYLLETDAYKAVTSMTTVMINIEIDLDDIATPVTIALDGLLRVTDGKYAGHYNCI